MIKLKPQYLFVEYILAEKIGKPSTLDEIREKVKELIDTAVECGFNKWETKTPNKSINNYLSTRSEFYNFLCDGQKFYWVERLKNNIPSHIVVDEGTVELNLKKTRKPRIIKEIFKTSRTETIPIPIVNTIVSETSKKELPTIETPKKKIQYIIPLKFVKNDINMMLTTLVNSFNNKLLEETINVIDYIATEYTTHELSDLFFETYKEMLNTYPEIDDILNKSKFNEEYKLAKTLYYKKLKFRSIKKIKKEKEITKIEIFKNYRTAYEDNNSDDMVLLLTMLLVEFPTKVDEVINKIKTSKLLPENFDQILKEAEQYVYNL